MTFSFRNSQLKVETGSARFPLHYLCVAGVGDGFSMKRTLNPNPGGCSSKKELCGSKQCLGCTYDLEYLNGLSETFVGAFEGWRGSRALKQVAGGSGRCTEGGCLQQAHYQPLL